MYVSNWKLWGYVQLVFAYRRFRYFVWNPKTRYAFRCVGVDAMSSLVEEFPHFERLVW